MVAPTSKKTAVDPVVSHDRNHMMSSVAATLDLLELFAQHKTNELQFSDFVQGLERPKSSVHRMLATLVNTGFILQDEDTRKYRLTLKLWRLGVPALEQHDLSQVARPYLRSLMRSTDETVHLAVSTNDGNVVYVAKFESQRSIRVQTQLGGVVPSYCTATGRSILANDPLLWEIVQKMDLRVHTEHTVTRIEELVPRFGVFDNYDFL
jgi:DNA-binding IclR family transcriptional regulator